jgi:hypothetical protein
LRSIRGFSLLAALIVILGLVPACGGGGGGGGKKGRGGGAAAAVAAADSDASSSVKAPPRITRSSSKKCGDSQTFTPEEKHRTLAVKMKSNANCSVQVTVECDGGTNPPKANAYQALETMQSCDEGFFIKQAIFECLEGTMGDNCSFDYSQLN